MVIHYFNINNTIPNRDLIYIKNFLKTGHDVRNFQDNSSGLKKFLKIFNKKRHENTQPDILWVGYTAYILVPFIKIVFSGYLVFNASNSLYDGMIISRKVGSPFSFVSIKYWMIDFLSFLFADLILVETNKQKEYISKKFFVNKNKIIRAWTGADDEFFFKDDSIKKDGNFTVVFRGGFLPESGVDSAVEAAKILKNKGVRFRIIGWGILEDKIKKNVSENNLENVDLFIGKNFTEGELRNMMQSCHICLGQLSNHSKLLRTIPYKAFESLAMGMPYLTARKEGILELLEENKNCLCFNPGDPSDLAQKIIWAKNNPVKVEEIAKFGYDLYNSKLKSEILAKDLISEISNRLKYEQCKRNLS